MRSAEECQQRQAEFVRELGRAALPEQFGYEVEIERSLPPPLPIVPPSSDFQAPEESTVVVGPEEMEEIVNTPPPLLPLPDLPLIARERNFETGLRHALAAAGLGSLSDEIIAKARAWPFDCNHIGEPTR